MPRGEMRNWIAAALLVMPCQAIASDLYATQTITSGTAPERRDIGFAQCLRDVVVRVTGNSRLLNEPRVAEQARHAGDLIASHTFRDRMGGIPIHDEQGSYDRPHDLTCVFDQSKLDAFLATLGGKPWRDRPLVVAVVAIRDMKGAGTMLADDSPDPRDRDMRAALMNAGERAALPFALPTRGELVQAGLDPAAMAGANPTRLDGLAKATRAGVLLTGTVVWSDKDLGWVASWQLAGPAPHVSWGISGVGFDDAFRNAVAGAAQVLSGNEAP
ncbi:DUF2066 domain-containing protein [Aminobacter sp. P9b]|uniref:DUF2066 domain-containing protein n=1 Tax=Aminobacter sp. P9b TaxID=3133697 RepID=UPI0032540A66